MKRLSLLILFLFSFLLQGQVFMPLAQGLPDKPSISTNDNMSLYYGYNKGFPAKTHIHKWNGYAWSTLPHFNGFSTEMFLFQGELYLITEDFNTVLDFAIYKLENGSWQQKGPSVMGQVKDVEIMANQVILAGPIYDASLGAVGLVSFDGNNFSAYRPARLTDSIQGINLIQNQLWAVGTFSSQLGTDTSSIMRYNSQTSSWEYPATKKSGNNYNYNLKHIFELNGKVYTASLYSSNIYEVRNDSLIELTNAPLGYYSPELVVHNNQAYFGGFDFRTFNGSTTSQLSPWPANSYLLNLMGNDLFISTHNAQFAGLNLNYVFKLGLNNLALVQGTIYEDANGNCNYENGEAKNFAAGYSLNLGANSVFIGATGNYTILLPAGTYSINNLQTLNPLDQYLNHKSSCAGQSSITVQAGQNYIHDIPFEHDGTMDRGIELSSFAWGRLRQGFTESIMLDLYNPGDDFNGPINLEVDLPSHISYISSNPYFMGQSNGTLSFQINGINKRERIGLPIRVQVALSAGINDTLCLSSRIVANTNDIEPKNDTNDLCLRVVAAYDPNDKRANIEESTPGLSNLSYHIRFQNTGTDTAYNVVVVDTLEAYFDPTSIELGSASHPYSFRLEKENILVWNFENILLPDSTTNLAESQGFFTFKLDVDPSLAVGSIIDNDAEIYFDFQAPIHTNHAQTFIVDGLDQAENPSAPELKVYPNPFSDGITIETLGPNTEMKLFSSQGKLLGSFYFSEPGKHQLALSNLKTGVYILRSASSSYRILKQ